MSPDARSSGPWQLATMADLRTIAAGLPIADVVAVGSAAGAAHQLDPWSDLDVLVVAEPGRAGTLWPDLSWLAGLGEVAAYAQSASPPGGTSRLLLADGRRVDVLVTDVGTADARWRELARAASPAEGTDAVETGDLGQIGNRLLFEAAIAIAKAARGERLVSAHLAVGLLQRCLEAAMVIRDLAERTNHHPGPRRHDGLADLLPAVPAGPRPRDVLLLIGRAVDCFAAIIAAAASPPPFSRRAVDLLLARALAE